MKEIIANSIKLLHIIRSNDNIILRVIVKVIVYIIFSEAINFSVTSREKRWICLWYGMFLARKYIKGCIFAHSL